MSIPGSGCAADVPTLTTMALSEYSYQRRHRFVSNATTQLHRSPPPIRIESRQ
jgi:hypothetical protein